MAMSHRTRMDLERAKRLRYLVTHRNSRLLRQGFLDWCCQVREPYVMVQELNFRAELYVDARPTRKPLTSYALEAIWQVLLDDLGHKHLTAFTIKEMNRWKIRLIRIPAHLASGVAEDIHNIARNSTQGPQRLATAICLQAELQRQGIPVPAHDEPEETDRSGLPLHVRQALQEYQAELTDLTGNPF